MSWLEAHSRTQSVSRRIRGGGRASRLLDRVIELAGADGALVFELVEIRGRPVFAHVHAAGPARFCRATRELEGTPLLDYLRRRDDPGPRPCPSDLFPCDRFDRVSADAVLARSAWQAHWGPADIRGAVGTTVLDGDTMRGGVMAVRIGRSGFGRRALTALKLHREHIAQMFDEATARRPSGRSRPGVLLFDASGAMVSSSIRLPSWLSDPLVLARIGARAVELVERGDESVEFFLQRAQFTLERLEGTTPRVVAFFDAGRPVRLTARRFLTPAQRAVAELAIVGATIDEIARHQGRSSNTVRHHLKGIYERLGIGSRAELASMWG